ncbi:MAG: hypothetical protein J7K04_16480 [Spirochaetales bacterium]|nr:hypothetical protein [Spirochaetales bacterium]
MHETDLKGFNPESAREYVLLYITTLKKTNAEIAKINTELKKWENRARLAEANNKLDLLEIARNKVMEIKDRLAVLNGEKAELKHKVSLLKQNLKKSKLSPQYSVDADSLLAEFQMLLGEEDTAAKELKNLEIENNLDTLKEKVHKKHLT